MLTFPFIDKNSGTSFYYCHYTALEISSFVINSQCFTNKKCNILSWRQWTPSDKNEKKGGQTSALVVFFELLLHEGALKRGRKRDKFCHKLRFATGIIKRFEILKLHHRLDMKSCEWANHLGNILCKMLGTIETTEVFLSHRR